MSLNVLSYNVHLFPRTISKLKRIMEPNAPPYDESRVTALKDNIRATNPDVICFNEMWDIHVADRIAEDLSDVFPHSHRAPVLKRALSTDMIGSGLMILSKYPIEDPQFVKYNKSAWTDSLMEKGYLAVTINNVRIFSTHMQSIHLLAYFRQDNIRQLMEGINAYRQRHPRKHVLAIGDININSEREKEYNMITQVMKSQGLNELELNGKNIQTIPNSTVYLDYAFSTAPGRSYTAPGLMREDELKESFAAEYKYSGNDISDHYPLLAILNDTTEPPAEAVNGNPEIIISSFFFPKPITISDVILCVVVIVLIVLLMSLFIHPKEIMMDVI